MRLVLTLATPHQRSPAHLQPALARFYAHLAGAPVPHVPVVSLAGGGADVQVGGALWQVDVPIARLPGLRCVKDMILQGECVHAPEENCQ